MRLLSLRRVWRHATQGKIEILKLANVNSGILELNRGLFNFYSHLCDFTVIPDQPESYVYEYTQEIQKSVACGEAVVSRPPYWL